MYGAMIGSFVHRNLLLFMHSSDCYVGLCSRFGTFRGSLVKTIVSAVSVVALVSSLLFVATNSCSP